MTIRTIAGAVVATWLAAGCTGDDGHTPDTTPKPALFGADTATSFAHAVQFVNGPNLGFKHQPSRTDERYLYEIFGGGLAWVDVNRDGAVDLVVVNSGSPTGDRPPGAGNRLYLNRGDGTFDDATDAWGLTSTGYGMGVTTGDFDDDGWTDLFFTAYGPGERMFRNTGTGFRDVTPPNLPTKWWSTSAGTFDLENDGDLDLYVTHYIDYTTENAVRCYVNQLHTYCTPDLYAAVPDRVYRNDGGGVFTDVSDAVGIGSIAGKGLALLLADIDLDGDVDAYVANDLSRNGLFMNEGGHFTDISLTSGVGYSENGKEEAGMGADLADVNGDGKNDIVVTNFQAEPNSMYLQTDELRFRERSDALGIGAATRARLGFGCDFFDVDNDGDEDLLVANGHVDDRVTEHTATVTFPQANSLFLDVGDHFEDVTLSAGPALADVQVSRALATADIDGDGDLDFAIVNNGGTVQIGINTTKGGRAASLWLEGLDSNRTAVGAIVTVTPTGGIPYTRQIVGANSFQAASDPRVHLGLGQATGASVHIRWPRGLEQTIEIEAGRFYHVVEGRAPVPYIPGAAPIPPAQP